MTTNPVIGDTHWAWTGEEWIPCIITKITPSGKSFHCYNKEKKYGTYLPILMKDYRGVPLLKPKEAKSTPLF